MTTNTRHGRPHPGEEFDWRPFLRGWSAESASVDPAVADRHGLREARERRWLGFEPADPKAVAVLEARAGRPLPPSFRAFLEVTDGWRMIGPSVWLLARTETIRIDGGPADPGVIRKEHAGRDDKNARDGAGPGGRSLRLADDSALVDVLLDPLDVAEDGEWAVRVRSAWSGSEPARYPSFRAYMESAHERFLADAAVRDPHFVSPCTDALDADVERARRLALAGDPDGALTLLAPAVRAGRKRAASIQNQLAVLLGGPPAGGGSAARFPDSAYTVRELLPMRCRAAAKRDYSGEGPEQKWLRKDFPAVDPAVIESVSHAVADGTYRHTVEGPFGEAVARAWELARWGSVDEAWATLRDSMREWRPYDEEHVVPLGLVADGVLGPLLTPRRGRELLSASHRAAAAEAAVEPDGLAWLVAEERGFRAKWWLVLARGVEPTELPGLLGTGRGLSPHPVTEERRRETAFPPPEPPLVMKDRPGQLVVPPVFANGFPSAAAVGRAGTDTEAGGWAFALVERAGQGVMRSPAPAASAVSGGLVLSMGSTMNLEPDAPILRVTAAEAGRIVWEVTVGPPGITEPEARGEVPPALDPRRRLATGPVTDDPAAVDHSAPARWLCEALTAEFGVSVNHDAVVLGRLHSLEVPPWSGSPLTP
ncbi:SMI1/KNR4 family protein [Streptomyces sp. NPDC087420]|uniref:SMI1/KNR4 family protein n=1 Tax=Streptomyces sp. NPDC087420 TaxID=3365785 RepID=UPI003839AAF8